VNAFNPQRLRLARERAGLSIIDLARSVGVTARQVSNYERGASVPSSLALEKIVATLGFEERFYFGNSLVALRDEHATFRSLRRTTATQRNQVLAAGSLAMDLNSYIEQRFDLPPVDIPDLSDHLGQPEVAAATLRSMWGLSHAVPNAIALLEVHGVRVFSLLEELREVNAFSVWVGQRPFVFLNMTKTAEASRFDALHELAHLCLHRHECDPREMEAEAHRFSAAMLMPLSDVNSIATGVITLGTLVKLKRRWGVSVAALAHRLHELDIIGPWPYRNLCIALSSKGYRAKEPNPMERESSRVLAKVFAQLRTDGVTINDLASDLAIPAEEIRRLVFGLAIVGLDGGSTRNTSVKATARTLRAVK